MTEIAVPASGGTLALAGDQVEWTPVQRAALAHIGIDKAPQADQQVFMHVAQRTGLDPFAKQLWMIPRGGKWTIQTAIDGFRLIADRRPEYGGQTEPEWCGEDGVWRDAWFGSTPPAAARVGVIRSDWDRPIYGVAMFREYNQGNSMWKEKPAHMLAKIAEALALRKAFPSDLSGLYTDDEMAASGQPATRRGRVVIEHDAQAVTADELTGAKTVAQPAPAAADAGGRASQDQNKKLFPLLREAGIEDRNSYASQLLNRDISSYGQLTVADASRLIDNLEAILADDTTDGGTS